MLGAPFIVRETKVEGQSESLAERVSRRLGNDGDLSIRQAAATIRLAIGKVPPQIWKDGHVSLGALWQLYSQYPYMPRLRDRRVLDEGIVDMPMIWQTDAFALATGFDEAADRYIGLWTPDDDSVAPPVATDSLLLVRPPDVAVKQRETEVKPAPDADDETTPAVADKTTKTAVDIAFPPNENSLLRSQDSQLRQDRPGLQKTSPKKSLPIFVTRAQHSS